jgi:hypothetical protein
MDLFKVTPTLLTAYSDALTKRWGKGVKDFLHGLTVPFEMNDSVREGSIVHEFLETGNPHPELSPTAMLKLTGMRSRVEGFDIEQKVKVSLQCGDYSVLLSMKIDAKSEKEGVIVDWKTTRSRTIPTRSWYENSPQCKCYSLAGDFQQVEYRVIKLYGDALDSYPINDVKEYPFAYYVGGGYLDEISTLIESMLHRIDSAGLLHLLTVKP